MQSNKSTIRYFNIITKMVDQDSIKTSRSKKSDKSSRNFALNGGKTTKHVRLATDIKERKSISSNSDSRK